jgi:hypothetical protein
LPRHHITKKSRKNDEKTMPVSCTLAWQSVL